MRHLRVAISTALLFATTVILFQNCSPGFQTLNKSIEDLASQSMEGTGSIIGVNAPNPPNTTPIATATQVGLPEVVHVHRNGKGLCNSVSFSQVPTNLDYFIGRVMNESSEGACDSTDWSLGLFKMSWDTNTLTFVKYLLRPSVNDSTGRKIESSYDPHIAVFNNELWVAFECVGSFGIMASSCIAPFTIENGIDTSRMNVIVVGSYANSNTETYSASVPKLLAYKGALYIYWTVCRFKVENGGFLLVGVTTRGAKLAQESSGLRRIWVEGSAGSPFPASDKSISSEVWGGTANDSTANSMADIFDFHVQGDTIYASAAVGSVGCLTPLTPLFGCYRTRVASSTTPLGHHIFNRNFVKTPGLPSNPMEYVRFFKTPSGGSFMMGQFASPTLNGTTRPASMINPGYQKYSIDLNNLVTVPTGTSEGLEPRPLVSAAVLHMEFWNIKSFHEGCDASGPTNIACNAATSRYCQSQGFLSGAGIVQHSNGRLVTACVAKSSGSQLTVQLSQLKALNAGCTQIHTATGSCNSAVFHYCRSQGFPGGGFGPQEAGGDTLTVTCLKEANSRTIATTFAALKAISPACSANSAGGDSCKAAADLTCRNQGAVAGFGIVDYVGDDVAIGCVQ